MYTHPVCAYTPWQMRVCKQAHTLQSRSTTLGTRTADRDPRGRITLVTRVRGHIHTQPLHVRPLLTHRAEIHGDPRRGQDPTPPEERVPETQPRQQSHGSTSGCTNTASTRTGDPHAGTVPTRREAAPGRFPPSSGVCVAGVEGGGVCPPGMSRWGCGGSCPVEGGCVWGVLAPGPPLLLPVTFLTVRGASVTVPSGLTRASAAAPPLSPPSRCRC